MNGARGNVPVLVISSVLCFAAAIASLFVLRSGSCLQSDPPQCSTSPGPVGLVLAALFLIAAIVLGRKAWLVHRAR